MVRLPLDEVDVLARVGEGERRMDAGDPAADDQHVGVHGDLPAFERLVGGDAPDRAGDERLRLLGRRAAVGGHPG